MQKEKTLKYRFVHCLFEQSGTFKNVFMAKGYKAYDYDILNQFNETDYVIDLFNEINNCYNDLPSIFDNMTSDDLIVSFFPCTYFSVQNELIISGRMSSMLTWNEQKRNEYILNRKKDREKMFELLLKYIEICKKKKIPMIFENPYLRSYLLSRNELKPPTIIINDRRILGDNHIKPTGFWFYNLEPTYFTEYLKLNNEPTLIHSKLSNKTLRSHIHSDFALNFVNKFILGI